VPLFNSMLSQLRRFISYCPLLWRIPPATTGLCCVFTLFVGGFHSNAALANASIADEYQVKAVFLYNFANFVKWPEKAFHSNDDSFYICIYGKDPFKKNLDIAVQGEKVQGRQILIKRSNVLAELLNCQILFISDSEASDLKNILIDIGSRPILTVSDIVDFAQAGGIIEFYLQSSNVRLMINLAAARQVDLVISANLLRVSKIVKE
jgi:hypothetical protein